MDKQKDFEKGWEEYKEKKKQEIEEMAKEIAKRDCSLYEHCPKQPKHNCVSQDPEIMLESNRKYITIATWLVSAGYRKIPKGAVVLTREEYDELTLTKQSIFDMLEERDDKARKETAEKFAKRLKEHPIAKIYSLHNVCERLPNVIDEIAKGITENI